MATTKVIRSHSGAQPPQVRAHASTTTRRTKTKKKRTIAPHRLLKEFPLVKGKKLEGVEFSTMSEDHSLSLLFQDKTLLRFDIQPGFTMFADYADWKTGNQRLIKRWPPVRNRSFRE
jgi:hypothetical protein